MKIKALLLFLSFSFYGISQTEVQGDAIVKTVNVKTSSVKWLGEKVLGSHEGTINVSSGELLFSKDQLVGGSVVVDMTSITSTDLDGEMKGKLEGHLKSEDFFDVGNHNTATLTINKVVSKGTPGDYKVLGELSIKGISNPVKFYTNLNEGKATAKISIDRSEYNVRYGSGSFFDKLGDNTIYDEFILTVELNY